MNEAAPQSEPSMEEILASIRRIISEDDEPNAAPAEAAAAPDAEAAEPAPVAAAEPDPLPAIDPMPEPAPIPEPVAAAPAPPPMELPELPELPPPEMPPMAAMSAPSAAPAPAAAAPDHVLNLTDEVQPDGTVVNIDTGLPVNGAPAAPARPAAATSGSSDVVELELRDAPGRAKSLFGRKDNDSAANSGESPLVSTVTEQVAVESLAAVRPVEEPYLPPSMPAATGIGAQTIEQLVREAVRPLIKEWLDANLPSMVERLVAQEIERIGRRADN